MSATNELAKSWIDPVAPLWLELEPVAALAGAVLAPVPEPAAPVALAWSAPPVSG